MPHDTFIRPNDHILFQGDSITNAFRKPEEVCNAYQLGAGYAMLAAADLLLARPADNLSFDNRGVSGEGVKGLLKRWQEDCLDLKPTVLSILVGVNDSGSASADELNAYESTYRELLTLTRTELPDVRLILCGSFVLDVGNAVQERLGVHQRAAITEKLAAEFGARYLAFQPVFDAALAQAPAAYWSFDGIHPNAQGHLLMAKAWLEAVK